MKKLFLSCVQIWVYTEYPPPEMKTLTFFPEFKSELTKNTPPCPPSPKWKILTFFPEFKSELTQNTPHNPTPTPWRLKYVETVSPKDTISY